MTTGRRARDASSPALNPRGNVVFVAFDEMQLLDLAGPLQVFATANEVLQERSGRGICYHISVVSPEGRPITTSAGLVIQTVPLDNAFSPIDTLIVTGGAGVHRASDRAELLEWLKSKASTTRRVCAVCTGAFLLAKAGLLLGRRAATHWASCERLQEAFPEIRVESDPIFIRDGDVWTSAGVTAGIDLALALVHDDLGTSVTIEVARRLVVFLKRPGGQAQFSSVLRLQEANDSSFGELNAWIQENITADLRLERLAQEAGMSTRSFSRRYTASTGVTPAKAVETIRVETARRLLEESELSIKAIAARSGFGDEERLRRAFLRATGTSPARYKGMFGGYRLPHRP